MRGDLGALFSVGVVVTMLLVSPELKLGSTGSTFDVAARSIPVAADPQQTAVFRGGIDLVNIAVTVTDRRGNLVTELVADDFELFEEGRRQTIRYFATGEVESDATAPELHLGLLLDVSGSMEADIRFTRTASIRFLNMLVDAVDITVVDFDTEVRVARYAQTDFPRLIERIRQQKVRGWTALYDAIGVYLDGAAEQDGRKVMLLYTDGGDTRSVLRLRDVLDLLRASDVTVYAIGALQHQAASARTELRMVLQQIAEATGGQAFFPADIKDLDKVYEQVLAEIRAQYTLGYVSSNDKADGKWRRVEIKVKSADGRNLRVRSRKGYFAPYRP
jgi:Ca-activated chloride channel family protein